LQYVALASRPALPSSLCPYTTLFRSFTSVSLDPPLIAFFPDKKSTSFPRIREVGFCCVNVLSADQAELSAQFARSAAEKFDGVRSEEHTSELQSRANPVCRLLLEKKN